MTTRKKAGGKEGAKAPEKTDDGNPPCEDGLGKGGCKGVWWLTVVVAASAFAVAGLSTTPGGGGPHGRGIEREGPATAAAAAVHEPRVPQTSGSATAPIGVDFAAVAAAAAAEAEEAGLSAEDTKAHGMQRWLEAQGGAVHGVAATSSAAGGGRGIFATAPLFDGQLLLRVPATAWLTTATLAERSGVADLYRSDDVVRSWCTPGGSWALILGLEFERHNADSPWAPYLAALPTPTSPIWWGAGQLEQLQSPAVVAEVRHVQEHLQTSYDDLIVHLIAAYPRRFSAGTNTLESLTFSALTVWGRSFDLGRWNTTETGLIPYVDFANHQYKARTETSWDNALFELESDAFLGAGDEVYISYGDTKTSLSFLIAYGFIPAGYEYGDYITFMAPIELDDESLYPLAAVSTYRGDKVLVAHVAADGWVPESYLQDLARLAAMRTDHTDDTADPGGSGAAGAVFAEVLRALLQGVTLSIYDYPTTLAEDIAELESADTGGGVLTYDQWAVLTTRIRFKKIVETVRGNLVYRLASTDPVDAAWQAGKADSLTRHFDNPAVLLAGDLAIRESLFHVPVTV